MLPPLGLAAMLPVACRRCIHLIAELGLTSNQSAAARRDAPDSTASTTRSRNSKEHGFGIDPPSKIRINAASFNHPSPPRNPDSTQPKSALIGPYIDQKLAKKVLVTWMPDVNTRPKYQPRCVSESRPAAVSLDCPAVKSNH